MGASLPVRAAGYKATVLSVHFPVNRNQGQKRSPVDLTDVKAINGGNPAKRATCAYRTKTLRGMHNYTKKL